MPFDPVIPHRPLRALRRHHRLRLISYARRFSAWFDPDGRDGWALRNHDHLAACSCWMCGNPRRFQGERTRQEVRVAALPLRGGRGRVEDWD